jgi:ACR3 family arsenite efflux pump ArsB
VTSVREQLEQYQVWIYFGAILAGAAIGWAWPGASSLESTINPALALMLFVTFLQVPMGHLRTAIRNVRFVGTLITANFIAIPAMVAIILLGLPDNPMIRLGAFLVLLAPCIDYVVTFTHLGRGDARLLVAATPVLLILQMMLLPVFLSLLLGPSAAGLVRPGPFLEAFLWLIAVPLVAAGATQFLAERSPRAARVSAMLGLLPVPATALVLFLVLAAVMPQIGHALEPALAVLPFYVAFALLAPFVGLGVAKGMQLPLAEGRAIAFSSATRNSLVVLPLAFAVPGGVPILPAVIVTQTIVELFSELIYIRAIPSLSARLLGDSDGALS